jgi:fatty-acyl-CoA synthase
MYPGTYAAQFPDKPAVIMADGGGGLTYRELDQGSARLARYLRERGLRRGDHIALLTGNCPAAFEVYWAALRSGLYITAVNRHLSVPEIGYIVEDCGAKALIVSARLRALAEGIAPAAPRALIRLSYGGEVPGYEPYEASLAGVPAGPLPEQPCGGDMLYSSGTTGRPKGVERPLPDREITEAPKPGESSMEVFAALYGFGPDMVYLSPGPVYHAAPLRFCGLVHAKGGTVVLMERFDAEAALAAIERHRATHSQWVPTMFVRMLKLEEPVRARYDLSSLRIAIHAAAPCPVDVKHAMISWWGPVLREYYSSTEGNGMTVIDSEQWLRKPGSVGRAGFGAIRICDSSGTELPPGQIGTVYFEREKPPFSYHGDPVKTEEARHPRHPNWTTIGDIGYLDSDGFLFLTDRKAFMIISGGVNIYPQEVENALTLHPKVYDVAVIGVPDPEMGESVLAVVQPAPGAESGPGLAGELRDYLRERIAHYKVPRDFDFTDDLPRTPTGKLVKGKLRERYLGPATRAGGPGPRTLSGPGRRRAWPGPGRGSSPGG